MKKILFVTGTDTGVGKTVLTAMLLAYLRQRGVNALAMKPFSSGSRADARLLHRFQSECLTLDEVNPFYFDKPLAPAAAAGPRQRPISLPTALKHIRCLADRCDLLIVEGAGGLLAPLGKSYILRDLIRRLQGQAIVVCSNRLGVINHVALTAEAMQTVGIKAFTVVMMGAKNPDLSSKTNPRLIRRILLSTPVFCLPYLGKRASTAPAVKINVKYLKKTLAHLLGADILRTFFHRKKRVERRNLLTIRFKHV